MRTFSRLPVLAVLALVIAPLVSGPAAAVEWAKSIGGAGPDEARAVVTTADGGYVVAGATRSFGAGGSDAWVVRLDAAGNIVWQRTFGAAGDDRAQSVQATSDHGFIVAGWQTVNGARLPWVMKLDDGGNVLWQRVVSETPEEATSVQQTHDGGYVVAGHVLPFVVGPVPKRYPAWVRKLDAGGNVLWQKSYGGSEWERAQSIQTTADGGYVASGDTATLGGGWFGAWVFKLDAEGNVGWSRNYGGARTEEASAVQPTPDGGYVTAGRTQSYGVGGYDAWVLKLDATGGIAWQRTFGGAGDDAAQSVELTADGGYLVAGSTASFGAGGLDAWVLKLDATGRVVWQHTFGGTGDDVANSARPTADGGYVVAGSTLSFGAGGGDMWVMKLDADGFISGCADIGISNGTAAASGAPVQNAAPTVRVVYAVSAVPAIAIAESTAAPLRQCHFAGPVPADIPALSGWGLIAAGVLLALVGFAFVGART
jgi:hypothetical protein